VKKLQGGDSAFAWYVNLRHQSNPFSRARLNPGGEFTGGCFGLICWSVQT